MPIIDLSKTRSGEPEFFSAQITQGSRFYFDLSPSPRIPVAVVCGGLEECSPDYHVSRSTFDYCTVEFVADGRGSLKMGGQTHRLQAGSVFVYGPQVKHVIRSGRKDPMVKYFVSFAGRRANALLQDTGLCPGTIVQTLAPDDILSLVDELIAAGQRHSPRAPTICALILEQILHRLAETTVQNGAAESQSFHTFQRCRRFINNNYRSTKDLKKVAVACAVNSAYLCRLFQRYHKQSPYQYLNHLKMAFAADLLEKQPDRSIKEISAELGFADQFFFSRAFKNVYGLSPRNFRLRRRS